MKRRSFLAFLGLAPAAPAIAKASPDFKSAGVFDSVGLDGDKEYSFEQLVAPNAESRQMFARLRYVDGRYSRHVPCEFGVDAGCAYNINAIVFPAVHEFVTVDRVEIIDGANGRPIMYDTLGVPLCVTAGDNVCIEPGNFRASLS